MDPQVQVALITALASLGGVLVGAIPSYLIARSQHRLELRRQRLEWRKEYREKLLSKVEEALWDRARGVRVSPSLHMVGVFDPALAKIMGRLRESLDDDLLVAAYKRMEELIGELE
jgi:hypothetical protein